MPSVESRLTALANAIHRRQLEQIAPVDGLSQSIFELGKELAALADAEKVALLEAVNITDGESNSLNLTTRDIEYFIADYGRKGTFSEDCRT